MRIGIVVFPGSNCDHDCYHVTKHLFGQPTRFIWHKEGTLGDAEAVIIPGGFSYGDYLRTGAIARFSPVMAAVESFAKKGRPVLGICNGFQVLLESGLLPGAMLKNRSLRFVCKDVIVSVDRNDTPFTRTARTGGRLTLPIAHGEGNYVADDEALGRLRGNGQIVFRYCNARGEVTDDANPNGSVENIAGICNVGRNVLGMMPHPERCCEAILGSSDGRVVFESLFSDASVGLTR